MRGASATACLVLLLLPGRPLAGQQGTAPGGFDPAPYLQFSEQGPYNALLSWYPPLIFMNGAELKDFIRSRTFAMIRESAGDLRAVDAIFVYAMELNGHNTALALMTAAVATFDHYVVGLDVPLLNLFFPLSNESEEDFALRVRNLPGALYPDTPAGPHGDRDKLQHFFGSALVSYAFESEGAAERVGEFVEFGEDLAIVDGMLDSRDRRANWQGAQFGAALLGNTLRHPSEFLRVGLAGTAGVAPEHEETLGCR